MTPQPLSVGGTIRATGSPSSYKETREGEVLPPNVITPKHAEMSMRVASYRQHC